MPELPEVETIKSQLNRRLKGGKIKKIEIFLPKIIRLEAKFFINKTVGAKIKKVWRRAKMIIIDLDNGYSLLIHLKLTGRLILCPRLREDYQKHTHLVFHFFDKSVLIFQDIRQFGYFDLYRTENLKGFFQEKKLGPEPLKKSFTLKKFTELLSKKPDKKIKPLLMEQNFIAGIGNIYAQEICWSAKISPLRLAKTLNKKEIQEIYRHLLMILKKAVKQGGTTAADEGYIDARGNKGKYGSQLKVYQREGEKCFRCKGIIERIVLTGRGTAYCPRCQK
jgi:formamidopyrimidine-DNA glycosylase